MGLRARIGSLIFRPVVDEALHGYARADEVADGRRDLEARVAALEKKLGMVMGALQATTADLVALREASTLAKQAMQQARSAQSTAESAADGVTALEDQLAKPAKTPAKRKAKKKTD